MVNDPRLGIHGGKQPLVCPVTGQNVAGRHFTTVSIGNGYYFRVLAKVKPQTDMDAVKTEMRGVAGIGSPKKRAKMDSEA